MLSIKNQRARITTGPKSSDDFEVSATHNCRIGQAVTLIYIAESSTMGHYEIAEERKAA